MKQNWIRKYVLAGVMSVCLMAALSACSSSDEQQPAGNEAVGQTAEKVTSWICKCLKRK